MKFTSGRITQIRSELNGTDRRNEAERERLKEELHTVGTIAEFIEALQASSELVEVLYAVIESSTREERIINDFVSRCIKEWKGRKYRFDGDDVRGKIANFKEQCLDGCLTLNPEWNGREWADSDHGQDQLKHLFVGNREEQAEALAHIHPQTRALVWSPLYALKDEEQGRYKDAPRSTLATAARSFLSMAELPVPRERRGQMKIIRKSQQQ